MFPFARSRNNKYLEKAACVRFNQKPCMKIDLHSPTLKIIDLVKALFSTKRKKKKN